MTKKEHNQAVKLIRSMFVRMERIFESSMDWNRYIDMIKEEERQHRNFGKVLGKDYLSRAESVRLFAVAQLLNADKSPSVDSFFHLRHSIYGAWALLQTEAATRIVKGFDRADLEAFAALDYAQLNQEPSE